MKHKVRFANSIVLNDGKHSGAFQLSSERREETVLLRGSALIGDASQCSA